MYKSAREVEVKKNLAMKYVLKTKESNFPLIKDSFPKHSIPFSLGKDHNLTYFQEYGFVICIKYRKI
jgi:hypothetical protein